MPRINMQELGKISLNNNFNIISLLLLDHSYLKECIDILKNKHGDKKIKLRYAKSFLDALKKHSAAEKNAIHAPLEEISELRSMILESEIEDKIIEAKVKSLMARISSLHTMSDEIEAEMNVLAEIVGNHLIKEENSLFPQMDTKVNKALLNEMGFQFMVIRQFSEKDLRNNPELQKEVHYIKNSIPIPTEKFIGRTREYFNAQSSLS